MASLYDRPLRLTGAAATVDAVTRAMDGAELAHIAAHGHLRSDNPLFSSLSMVDGPLTVHDLERLGRAPRQVVLAACDAAVSHLPAADEMLGLATALLSQGTTSLIAPVSPVDDAMTVAGHGALPPRVEFRPYAQRVVGDGPDGGRAARVGRLGCGRQFRLPWRGRRRNAVWSTWGGIRRREARRIDDSKAIDTRCISARASGSVIRGCLQSDPEWQGRGGRCANQRRHASGRTCGRCDRR